VHPRASDEHARAAPKRCYLAIAILAVGIIGTTAPCWAQNECLAKLKAANVDVADDGTVCGEAQNKACVFQLQLCLNQADGGCTAAPMKRKVKARGSCAAIRKLRAKPDGSHAACGSVIGIKVKTKKKGRREGKCKLVITAKSTDKPARRDVDKVTLVCRPNPGDCPATVTTPVTTTTTLPCIPACDCCVQPISDLLGCVSH